MNLRDLVYALAVENQKSFSRAAETCGVAQPTLSGQLRKLERELGVDLFERDGRVIRTTPVGAAILAQARIALEAAERIRALAASGADPLIGPLRIGMIPTLAPYVLPWLLPAVRRQLPQAPLILTEDVTPRLLGMLRDGSLDGAMLATDHLREGFADIPLFDEPFWLATSRETSLAVRASVSFREIDASSLLLLTDGHCLRDQALALCGSSERSTVLASDVRATSLETLLNLVGSGYGSTIVPALALELARSHEVATIPIADEGASRRIRLAHRAGIPRRRALSQLARIVGESAPHARIRLL